LSGYNKLDKVVAASEPLEVAMSFVRLSLVAIVLARTVYLMLINFNIILNKFVRWIIR
jgi:hypothetical protein